MIPASPDLTIRRKVKDDEDGLQQATRLSYMLEEAEFTYDLGVASPVFRKIRHYLDESVSFYIRHKKPDSNMQGLAKRQLRLANKLAVTVLVKCLNQILHTANQPTIVPPVAISAIETACHKLFHYLPGGAANVGQSTSGGGDQKREEDTKPLSMA